MKTFFHEPIFPFLFACLVLGFGLFFPRAYGEAEGLTDAIKIRENGSQNSLRHKFHSDNLIERLVAAVCTSIIVTCGMRYLADFSAWFFLPYFGYFWMAFAWKFTPTVNVKREEGLHPWHVSESEHTARWDRTIIRWAKYLKMPPVILNGDLHWWGYRIAIILLFLWIQVEVWFPHWLKPVIVEPISLPV